MNHSSANITTTIAIVLALVIVGSTAVNAFVMSATPAYATVPLPFTRVEEIPVDETLFVPCGSWWRRRGGTSDRETHIIWSIS